MNHSIRYYIILTFLCLTQMLLAQDYVLHSPKPEDGATDIPVGYVYLSCNTSDDYSGSGIYEVQYSTKPDFSSKRSIRTSNRVYSVDINADKPGTVYYWRVMEYSLSTGYFEQVSPVWHFTTAGTPPAGDCDLSDVPTSSDYYAATYFLCERSVLNGSKEDGKTNVEGKLKRSHLAKIAFRGVYLLNGREMPASVSSDYYPTVYGDIAVKTEDNDYYYQAARALLYLEYGDGVSPFDRNRLNFVPDDDISRLHTLKVLMETFNIRPDLNGSDNPFPNDEKVVALAANDPVKMGYVRKAAALGIITTNNAEFRPYEGCLRGEAFVMLARIMQKVEAGEIDDPNPQTADYFEPLNTTLATISLGAGIQMGNFNHYTKSSFNIQGVIPLNFAHSYNSYNTTLPDAFYGYRDINGVDETYRPLGEGWSHNYHSFITMVENKAIVHWGGGSIHVYSSDGTRFVPESIGIYDEFTMDGYEAVIKSKSQVTYRFSNLGASGAMVLYLKSVTDRNGNKLTLNYEDGQNGSKRISSVSDGYRQLTFSYLPNSNLLTSVSDPLGRSISFTYILNQSTGKYQLNSFTDAKGQMTSYIYGDASKRSTSLLLTKIQLPKGNYIENEYDQNCRLTNSQTGLDGVPKMKTSIKVAPSYGSDISIKSDILVQRENMTTNFNYGFNANNVITDMTGDEGLKMTAQYGNSNHPQLPTSLTTNSLDVDNVSYDERGNITTIKIKANDGSKVLTRTMTYDKQNNLTSITDAKGNTTRYTYDNKGNLKQIDAPDDVTVKNEIDSKGLTTKITNAMGMIMELEYNKYGNLTMGKIPALDLSMTADYDDASRLIAAYDALNRKVSYFYDDNDNLVSETDALGHSTKCDYDKNDNMVSVTNAKGGVTTLTYDNVTDWLTSVSFAGSERHYSYNTDGTLNYHKRSDGTILTYSYDKLGRLTDNGINKYEYDNMLRLKSVSSNKNSITFGYDGFNRITSVDFNGNSSNTVKYDYDDNGNLTEITYTNGKKVSYIYDKLNRMTSVNDWLGNTIQYTYRKDSKLSRIDYPNGMHTDYGFDEAGRIVSKKTLLANGTIIAGYEIVLDKLGNIIEQNAIEPFKTTPAMDSEEADYSYNDGNRIIKAGDIDFSFDANGNTTKRGSEVYKWDNADRLENAGGIEIEYDPTGLLRRYDDTEYTVSLAGNGDILSDSKSGCSYIYGAGLEERISVDGSISYYVCDMRGSVVAVVDNAGNITHRYQYDDFGRVVQREEQDFNPFRYVGKYGVMFLTEHQYYMRARHYDPTIGRFLSEDPIWNVNLYPYADNNPIMNIDPNGEEAVDFIPLATAVDDAIEVIDNDLYELLIEITQGQDATAVIQLTQSQLDALEKGIVAVESTDKVATPLYCQISSTAIGLVLTVATGDRKYFAKGVIKDAAKYGLTAFGGLSAGVASAFVLEVEVAGYFAYSGLNGTLVDDGVKLVDTVLSDKQKQQLLNSSFAKNVYSGYMKLENWYQNR